MVSMVGQVFHQLLIQLLYVQEKSIEELNGVLSILQVQSLKIPKINRD